MKNRKGMATRVLSLFLTAVMVLSAMPAGALAVYAEDAGSGLCPHHAEHTAECGYIAAQGEVPCSMGCTDTDGDGVIDHAEACAYTPAVEGQPCAYVCKICPMQALIDALPEAGDITADNAEEVTAQLFVIDEALAALTEEERGQVDIGRYTAAADALAALEQENAEESESDPVPDGSDKAPLSVQNFSVAPAALEIADDTLEISTAEELKVFRDDVNSGNSYSGITVKLTADINLNHEAWTPIGNYGSDTALVFSGTFDGGGHTISGLYISNAYVNYQGLFGYLKSGSIQNLTVDGTVTGNWYAGGIVSYNDSGAVINCSNTGTVTGNLYVSGIVGFNDDGAVTNCSNTGTVTGNYDVSGIVGRNPNGTVTNCFNTGVVTGSNDVGGIVGSNDSGAVTSCSNTGTVTGSTGSYYVGGVVGVNSGGAVTNCYYLDTAAKTGIVGSGKATSKTLEEYRSGQVAHLLQGTQETPAWGQTIGTEDYPVLTSNMSKRVYRVTFDYAAEGVADVVRYTNRGGTVEVPEATGINSWWTEEDEAFTASTPVTADITVTEQSGSFQAQGSGTQSDPYLIPDLETLEFFRDYINAGNACSDKYFRVTADINLNHEAWTPIGDYGSNTDLVFSGTFDGGGHTISGLDINTNANYQGLFGYLRSGSVQNLTVDGTVTGKYYVGGIVGFNNGGTVTNCTNTGKVTGDSYVGGIVGFNDGGTVTNCANTGEVTGSFYVGGIVGFNYSTVTNCTNIGTVAGRSYVGGIVGSNENTVANCYYLGTAASTGIGYGSSGEAVSKTAEEYQSGQVAYLLQGTQDSLVWGQIMGTDVYPVLTSDTDQRVYRVTFLVDGAEYAARYANSDGTVEVPEMPDVGRWKTEDGDLFTGDTAITSDITVSLEPALVRSVSVTADKDALSYGDAAPTLTATVTLAENVDQADVTYQWYLDGTAIDGATSAAYIPGELDAGKYVYTCTAAADRDSQTSNSVTVTVNPADISGAEVTLSQTSFTYNGTAKTPSVTVMKNGNTLVKDADYTVSYEANVDAGTAKVTVKAVEGGNYSGSQTVEFKIDPASISDAAVALTNSLTYNGAEQTQNVTVTVDGAKLIEGTDYTLSGNTGTNAGEYTLTVAGTGNYTGTATAAFTIKKIQAGVTVPNSIDLIYSGSPVDEAVKDEMIVTGATADDLVFQWVDSDGSSLTSAPVDAGTYTLKAGIPENENRSGWQKEIKVIIRPRMAIDPRRVLEYTTHAYTGEALEPKVVKVTYNPSGFDGVNEGMLIDPSEYTVTYQNNVNAGTATVTITDNPGGNWTFSESSYTETFTITKADAPTVPEQRRDHLRDESVTGTIDLGKLLPADKGETSYAVIDCEGVATGSVEGDTLTYTTVANAAAVSGDLTVTVVMQNYQDVTITVTVNLIDPLAVSGLPGSVTYGDEPFTLTASGGIGDASVTWESSDDEIATVDGNGRVTVTGAGTVTITATKAGGANYGADAVVTVPFTVAKRPVTVSGITAENKVYDGAAAATLNYAGAAFDGIVAGDSLTVTAAGAFADADAGEDKTASITGLTLGGADVGNYVLAADGQQTETTAAILPRDITVNITPNGGVYGGTITPATAEPVGVVGDDAVPVTLTYTGTANDGAEVDSTEVPALAGTYTVTASIENGNYTLTGSVTADFVVARANAEFSVSPDKADKTYGDEAFALTASHKGGGKVTYASSNEDVATVDGDGNVTLHNAGEAVITVTLAQTANYEGGEITVTITVARKNDTLTVKELTYTVTYGDADFIIAPTTDSGSTVTFTSSNIAVATVDETGRVHIVGAGEAEITLETAESENYNAVSRIVTVTVKPKEITVTADDLTRTYGEDDPELTWTAEGLVNGDVLTDITVTRKDGEGAGNYTITATQKTGANPNYEIRFVDGTLTIVQKDISNAAVELGAALIENGETQTQEIQSVTVQNSRGEAMDVTYTVTGNTGKEWGTYTMTITGTGNFTGTTTKTFVIAPAAQGGSGTTGGGSNGAAGGSAPKTGDSSRPGLWMLLMLLSCGGMTVMIFRARRKRKGQNQQP